MALNTAAGIVVSRGNTTTIPLSAGATFVGATELVDQYQEIDINLAGAPSVAPGSFYFEFSPDGTHWDVSVLAGGMPRVGPSIVPQYLRIILPYFRVRYTNGDIPLTQFRLTTVFHRTASLRLTRYLNQTIDDSEGVENTRAVVAYRDTDGTYVNVDVNKPMPVTSSLAPGAATATGVAAVVAKLGDGTAHVVVDSFPLPSGASTDAGLAAIFARQADGTQHVTVDSVPLGITDSQLRASPVPVSVTGVATSAKQDTANTSLSSIDVKLGALVSGRAPVDGSGVTQPISAAALPLPSGASTANGVAAIVTKLGDGTTHVIVDSMPSDEAGLTNAELRASAVPVSTATLPLPSGASTEATLAAASAKLPATVGQKTMTSSMAVVIASDQSTLPVSIASLPLPSGAATSAKQDTMIAGLQAINSLVPSVFDYISLAYTDDDLTTVVYKNGGAGGSTVATLSLAYVASVLQSVART